MSHQAFRPPAVAATPGLHCRHIIGIFSLAWSVRWHRSAPVDVELIGSRIVVFTGIEMLLFSIKARRIFLASPNKKNKNTENTKKHPQHHSLLQSLLSSHNPAAIMMRSILT